LKQKIYSWPVAGYYDEWNFRNGQRRVETLKSTLIEYEERVRKVCWRMKQWYIKNSGLGKQPVEFWCEESER